MAAISSLIAAGIGAAGAIGGATIAAGASKNAANAQAKAADQATQFQRDAAQQTRVDQAPWMQSGQTALYALMDNLGLSRPSNPSFYDVNSGPIGSQYGNSTSGQNPPFGTNSSGTGSSTGTAGTSSQTGMTTGTGFQQTPGYQFSVDQSNNAVQNRMAALGLAGSGDAMKAINANTMGLANQEYGNYLNRLASLAGMGQTATNSMQGATTNAANNSSSIAMQAGNNRASSLLGQSQIYGNAIRQFTGPNGYAMQAYNGFNSGGGGGANSFNAASNPSYSSNYLSPYGRY